MGELLVHLDLAQRSVCLGAHSRRLGGDQSVDRGQGGGDREAADRDRRVGGGGPSYESKGSRAAI